MLRGAFRLLARLQAGTPPGLDGRCDAPAIPLRHWDLWDNLDGSIERGYGGDSLVWPSALAAVTEGARQRWVDAARLLASVGINGVVLNNVNACRAGNQAILAAATLRALAATVYPVSAASASRFSSASASLPQC